MPDLFDDTASWQHEPQKAFDAFVTSTEFLALSKRRSTDLQQRAEVLSHAPIRMSTARVYIAMWARFLRWLATHKPSVFDVSRDDLMSFLEQREASGKRVLQGATIRRQYLTLFERVYTHLEVSPNPATHAAFDVFKHRDRGLLGVNAPKAALTEAEQIAFMRALPVAEAASGNDPTAGWKRRRDRAMQALMLGAGLKVAEVVGIYTSNIGEKDQTGSVPITISPASAGGTVRAHQTQLRPFAAAEVLQWLRERRALPIPGQLLFPATLNGGRLDKATVYRQVKASFTRAGIDAGRQGGRTLRNSFAVRELKAGESLELVGEFMGHRRRRSTEHYMIDVPNQQSVKEEAGKLGVNNSSSTDCQTSTKLRPARTKGKRPANSP
jgi:site-specific recombinase XerD